MTWLLFSVFISLLPPLTEERDGRQPERPDVNWFVGNFICLIDWLYCLFLPSTIFNCDRQFCFLIWLNVWFYSTDISLTTWHLWNIHISLGSCHSSTITACFRVHYTATCLIFAFLCHNELHFQSNGWWMIHKIPFVHISHCISSFCASTHTH